MSHHPAQTKAGRAGTGQTGQARAAPGVALIVHGLGEHIGRYEHVARHLNQHGWATVGFDHRGHGNSPGKRGALRDHHDLLHDLAAVIDATRRAYPSQPLVLIGYSLGGAIAARFASAQASPSEPAPWARPIDGLVLSSPALAIPIGPIQRLLLATEHTEQDVGAEAVARCRSTLAEAGITHVINCVGFLYPAHFDGELAYQTLYLQGAGNEVFSVLPPVAPLTMPCAVRKSERCCQSVA